MIQNIFNNNMSNVLLFRTIMSTILVPPGWVRKRIGKRIVYITDHPRVQIQSVTQFDKLKSAGRYLNVTRQMLNFSLKVR